jgi:hypothetical protein
LLLSRIVVAIVCDERRKLMDVWAAYRAQAPRAADTDNVVANDEGGGWSRAPSGR